MDEDRNLAQEMEDNFGGMGKKNTRKKKNTQQNMQDDLIADAFDEGADSDEIHAKKGGKNKKKNKGKKNQEQEDAETLPNLQEETKGEDIQGESINLLSLGINVVYCGSKYFFNLFYF